MGKIDNFRLARRIFEHRRALGQCRRHQRVLRGTDRDDGKLKNATLEASGRAGMHIAIAQVQLCAHGFECTQVQVYGPRPDGATTGQGHNSMSIARQHWPKNQNRGTHFADDVIIGHMIIQGVRRQC